jgi:hypothetical protein
LATWASPDPGFDQPRDARRTAIINRRPQNANRICLSGRRRVAPDRGLTGLAREPRRGILTGGNRRGELLRRAADEMECRVEGRPRRDAFYAREGAIVRFDLLGVIGAIASVGLFVAGQRRRVEFALGRRQ